eukprot:11541873-Alexandrium_andersonii.AAC.1
MDPHSHATEALQATEGTDVPNTKNPVTPRMDPHSHATKNPVTPPEALQATEGTDVPNTENR